MARNKDEKSFTPMKRKEENKKEQIVNKREDPQILGNPYFASDTFSKNPPVSQEGRSHLIRGEKLIKSARGKLLSEKIRY
ncbi:hypothetical protein LSTR_LSTR004879 [Laodelphax striatellus]|uniref:Uncharacterized protein n=1 Tax=Laodelphax striatellus TaxID=195883 RepID=A0A482XNR3_LAOST|nr:hypothetical protein LSTR_LSTR004879 [Laodelphax striatellus]